MQLPTPGPSIPLPAGALPPSGTSSSPQLLPGYLVATVPAHCDSEQIGNEESTSACSSEDEDVVPGLTSCSFRDGNKFVRDSSFRKVDAAKIERAKEIRARSSCLMSHLVTPGPCHRSVDESSVRNAEEQKAPNTLGTTHRKIDIAERGPLTEQAYYKGLRIPPYASGALASTSRGDEDYWTYDASEKPLRRSRNSGRSKLDNLSEIAKAGFA
mmetsp:Transcript_24739/g.41038  ORF Transcript_24739/g.41038 Transcript_24739/m.41038 type:complete len:213 (-) Transcript_24739:26-664(-)